MKKTSLITEITGQDRDCLSEYLAKNNWNVYGTNRRGSTFNSWRLKKLEVLDKKFYRPSEIDCLRDNSEKAKSSLNWEPKTNFNSLVKLMVDDEVKNYV
tara:strand:+ start:491 stop:787 length:297 start_codon:yes stop_codon:yes gene_type:complete